METLFWYLPALLGIYKTLHARSGPRLYKKPLTILSASRSLLPVTIPLKLSILNVSSACTRPLRKAHVLLSPLKVIVCKNPATDVRNLSPYHGRTCPSYSPDRGLAGGKEERTWSYDVCLTVSLKRVGWNKGGDAGTLPPLGSRVNVPRGWPRRIPPNRADLGRGPVPRPGPQLRPGAGPDPVPAAGPAG